jgi:hypothetical protein
VKEKTKVLLRTTTSIGERFLLALDLLAAEEPEAFVVNATAHSNVRRAVAELRTDAVATGYVGTPS